MSHSFQAHIHNQVSFSGDQTVNNSCLTLIISLSQPLSLSSLSLSHSQSQSLSSSFTLSEHYYHTLSPPFSRGSFSENVWFLEIFLGSGQLLFLSLTFSQCPFVRTSSHLLNSKIGFTFIKFLPGASDGQRKVKIFIRSRRSTFCCCCCSGLFSAPAAAAVGWQNTFFL